jgi:two-component system, LytTR family, sensor kinase
MPRSFRIRRDVAVLLYVLAWTALGVRAAITAHLDFGKLGQRIPIWEPFTWELSSHLVTAALLPLLYWYARRSPLGPGWPGRVVQHVAGVAIYFGAHVGGMVALRKVVYAAMGREYEFGSLSRELPYELMKDMPGYISLLVLVYAFEFYRRYRERSEEAARLEALLSRARLAQLESQLHPHFLYNTLNTISSVMYQDVGRADRMLARLGELLRASLDSGPPQVPLEGEVQLLEKYLDIMRARFGSRLDVRVTIDPGARAALVPRLILQPLVENAIKHGIASRPEGGLVEVAARVESGGLHLDVRDDGPGVVPGSTGRGIGLPNTAERLRRLYGDAARLDFVNAPNGGLRVTIALPLRVTDDVVVA